jgi:TetR/AcrR family transcriptional regulator, transcriptional repressor of bet genes
MIHAPTETRRQEIVEALLQLLGERSYAKATIQAIAQKAGVVPGLVHYHFATKQEILLGVVDEIEARLGRRLAAFQASATGPWDCLHALVDAHLALGPDADPTVVRAWVQLTAEALSQPEVARVWRAAVERQREQLDHAVRAVLVYEGRDPEESAVTVALVQSILAGAWQLASTGARVPEGFAAPVTKAVLAQRLSGGGR